MAFTVESWHNLSGKVSVKVGSTNYELSPGSMRIVPVPYTGGGAIVETDINGKRVSSFATKAFHIDVYLEWDEVGPYNYPAVCAILDAIISNTGTATAIQFSPYDSSDTTNRDASYYAVVPEITEEVMSAIWQQRARARKVKLILKAEETVSSIPDWVKF